MMPYNIYEQHSQQNFVERRVMFDESNAYGTMEELRAPPPPPPPIQQIYNDSSVLQNQSQNVLPPQQNLSSSISNSSQTPNSHQPLPQLPHQNNLILLNGQQASTPQPPPLPDQISIINNLATINLNQVVNISPLVNNSLNSNIVSGQINQNHNLPLSQLITGVDSNNIRWRDPDLHEVVEFLSHPNPIVKANAAAYLQHLSFMDDNVKQKARALGSIPALLNALNNELNLIVILANQQLNPGQIPIQPSRDVQRNALGALRNLSYGRQNDENKKAIKNANGINTLVNLLKYSLNDKELKELITGILWNLSSSKEIKTAIIDEAVKEIVNFIIIPGSGWDGRVGVISGVPINRENYDSVYATNMPEEIYWSTIFRNATGVLRNVSSAGEYARCKLRECDGLCESFLFIVRQAISKNDIDNKSIENCVCVLRNLSYRCQEVIDPDYDKHHNENKNSNSSPSITRASAIIGSVGKVGDNLGCFGGSRKKKENLGSTATVSSNSMTTPGQLNKTSSNDIYNNQNNDKKKNNESKTNQKQLNGSNNNEQIHNSGMQLLWQPDVVQIYLLLLSECSNPETLEAAAGAIQNLCACYWPVSAEIRAAVRKEKGLPVLVELLRMEVDRVVCAVATALRNLALDNRNKELIGKYAMRDLVFKLPLNLNNSGNNQQQHLGSVDTSDDTIAAVLATLNEVVSKNADFAKSLLEADGMDRLLYIIKFQNKFSSRVVKFTSQLLYNMWQHTDLRDAYRKCGYKESHFLVKQISSTCSSTTNSNLSMNLKNSFNSMSASCSANNTLSRPMSTQSATKFEDNNTRTLTKGTDTHRNFNLNNSTINNLQISKPEELPLNELSLYHNATDGVSSPDQQLIQSASNLSNAQQTPHNVILNPQPQQVNHAQNLQNLNQQQSMASNIYQSSGVPMKELNQLKQMNIGITRSVNLIRTEPVYAQVNRERKKQLNEHRSQINNNTKTAQDSSSTVNTAGDSWV